MIKKAVLFLPPFVLAFFLIFSPLLSHAQETHLSRGVEQYQQENFEEAQELLEKARSQAPDNGVAAFFLGLTYKQLFQFEKAAAQFRDSLTLEPKFEEAVVELIEVLYRMKTPESLSEAKSWIGIAEMESLLPAKISFLEGLILQQEGETEKAIESFERSMKLDPSYTQAAEVQIAICHIRDRELGMAKEMLQTAIQENPTTDLAGFARRYQDIVEKRMELEKPLRVTAGVFAQYDDNVVLNPADASIDPLLGTTDEESYVTRASLRVDYVPILKSAWLFNAQYSFLGSFYAERTIRDNYNSLINNVSVSPGYNFGPLSVNLPLSYAHVMVMEDGRYDLYLETFNSGPQIRTVTGKNQMLEAYAGYVAEDYDRPPLAPEEDRNAVGFKVYLSWFWTYTEGGFSNLKYEFSDFNAEGDNYDRRVFRLSANLIHPLAENLKVQLAGQFSFEPYKNIHSITKIPTPTVGVSEIFVEREDEIYQGSAGLTWEFYKNASLILQYSHTRSNSNIDLFTYKRNLWTAGIEYRF